jgi:hypothetical protein
VLHVLCILVEDSMDTVNARVDVMRAAHDPQEDREPAAGDREDSLPAT